MHINKLNSIEKSRSNFTLIYVLVIALLNIIFYKNFFVSLFIVIIELTILLKHLLKRDIYKYFINYLIFTSLSLEQEFLVGTDQFYGFKNFRIGGINLAILALLPPVCIILIKGIDFSQLKKKYMFYKTFVIFSILTINGIFWGMLTLAVNDNGIQSFPNVISLFVNRSYFFVIVMGVLLILAYLYINDESRFKLIGDVLLYILISTAITMVFSLIFSYKGTYSNIETLLVPLASWMVPFLLIVPFYTNKKYKFTILLLGVIGTLLTIIYNATGKGLILVMIIPFIFFFLSISKKKYPIAFIMIIIAFLGILIIPNMLQDLAINSQLTQNKSNEVMGLLKFWEPNWLKNMPTSPRYRVVEFIDICIEYIKKPYYLFFGKGYIGTFKDHILGFNMGYQSAFSYQEYVRNIFYAPHDAINNILLTNGLLGMMSFLYFIKLVINNGKKSFWLIFGIYWVLIMYGFSITLSVFGITGLMFGLSEIYDKDEQMK